MPRCHLYTGQVFKKSTEVKSQTVGLSRGWTRMGMNRETKAGESGWQASSCCDCYWVRGMEEDSANVRGDNGCILTEYLLNLNEFFDDLLSLWGFWDDQCKHSVDHYTAQGEERGRISGKRLPAVPRHHSSTLRMPGNGQVCGFPVRDLVLGSKPVSSFTTLDKTMFVQYLSSDKCQRRLKLGFFSPPKAHWFSLLPANIILLFLMIHLCRMRQRKYTGFQEKQTFL